MTTQRTIPPPPPGVYESTWYAQQMELQRPVAPFVPIVTVPGIPRPMPQQNIAPPVQPSVIDIVMPPIKPTVPATIIPTVNSSSTTTVNTGSQTTSNESTGYQTPVMQMQPPVTNINWLLIGGVALAAILLLRR